jgi:hypothetical protein
MIMARTGVGQALPRGSEAHTPILIRIILNRADLRPELRRSFNVLHRSLTFAGSVVPDLCLWLFEGPALPLRPLTIVRSPVLSEPCSALPCIQQRQRQPVPLRAGIVPRRVALVIDCLWFAPRANWNAVVSTCEASPLCSAPSPSTSTA